MISEIYNIDPDAQWGYMSPTGEGDNPLKDMEAVLPVQTHTSNIGILTDIRQQFPETDALITQLRGVAIGVRTADCVPILMYAPDIEAVAAVHAGWKGTIAGIAVKTFRKLVDMGADPGRLQVRVGAYICSDCYEIDEDLALRFKESGLGDSLSEGIASDILGERLFDPQKPHLDLGSANFRLLLDAGMLPGNFEELQVCTRHTAMTCGNGDRAFLPSWRRNPGEVRRIVSWIRLSESATKKQIKQVFRLTATRKDFGLL